MTRPPIWLYAPAAAICAVGTGAIASALVPDRYSHAVLIAVITVLGGAAGLLYPSNGGGSRRRHHVLPRLPRRRPAWKRAGTKVLHSIGWSSYAVLWALIGTAAAMNVVSGINGPWRTVLALTTIGIVSYGGVYVLPAVGFAVPRMANLITTWLRWRWRQLLSTCLRWRWRRG